MTAAAPVQRQAQVKGGRKIRHVVYCSQEQHDRLTIKARDEGVTVAKLMVDTTLGDNQGITRRTLFNELSAVRALFNAAAMTGAIDDIVTANAALIAVARSVTRS